MDKDEITEQAQRLGTYPISIIEDQDCCQLFTPKHPATKARLGDVEAAERELPIEAMVCAAVSEAVVEDFSFPIVKYAPPHGPYWRRRRTRAEPTLTGDNP